MMCPSPGVTKLKFFLHISWQNSKSLGCCCPNLIFSTTCWEAQSTTIAARHLSHSAAAFWRRDADIPTLPALAEGLTHQTQLSEAICQTTELLVGCLDAVSYPYVYWTATACAIPTQKNSEHGWVCLHVNRFHHLSQLNKQMKS